MKNFQKIAEGVITSPLLNAVVRNRDLWNRNTLRTADVRSPHTQVEDIWLRFNELPNPGEEAKLLDDHESINYPAWFHLPEAQDLVLNLMRQVRGERLGRVLVTCLAPGKSIARHVDGGTHAAYYDRFHIVLQGLPGSMFLCGGDTVQMLTGEVWWFDNGVEHECINNSADDRIHIVADIRTCR